jgi:1,4-alpha-glucan branching enzyme
MESAGPDDYNLYLFHEGTLFESYKVLGAHLRVENDLAGVRFSVWAPAAREVRVIGDFNGWQGRKHLMEKGKRTGIWSLFVPEAEQGQAYKYEIFTATGDILQKADPYAFEAEVRPASASRIASLKAYQWRDQAWMAKRAASSPYDQPMLIYEVHLGSWRRKHSGDFLTYRELAHELVDYAVEMGYTHLELLPLAEHPYDGSWGYQATGYYAVTSRYGKPEDFMYFVDRCHHEGLGVIMDWVPGHFCKDAHGLRYFDGSPLFEPADGQRAESAQWDTQAFDLGKPEVQSFLISNALFWMDVYHIDGLRVDAVASMLYLDFGREAGQWTPNRFGGRENLEAVSFIKTLNEQVFRHYPGALMIAEESTQWPQVSAPTYLGGLGFNFKWNMGWMNDILQYMEIDPVHRKWHHNLLTFSFWYAFTENFVLPLSHDEVVHCKKSLLGKMPGDYWQKFANLRLLFAYMMAHPGKKLVFMGGELGQFAEWNHENQLDWNLLECDLHGRLQCFARELHAFYREQKPFWELDHHAAGFQWVDPHDYSQSIITFMRKGRQERDCRVVLCNFTPAVHRDYRVGVPGPGTYREIFNSDAEKFGGSGQGNPGVLAAEQVRWHNQDWSLQLVVPPLAAIVLNWEKRKK